MVWEKDFKSRILYIVCSISKTKSALIFFRFVFEGLLRNTQYDIQYTRQYIENEEMYKSFSVLCFRVSYDIPYTIYDIRE